MKQGSPRKQAPKPSSSVEVDRAQLKRLIEIQSQVVTLAKQNELAERKRRALQRSLTSRRGVVRRLLGVLAQFARRIRPNGFRFMIKVTDIAPLKRSRVNSRMEPIMTPVCQMAMISEPDGNTLCIHKRKAN